MIKFWHKWLNESTVAALAIHNEQRSPEFKSSTSEFVGNLLFLWKNVNVNRPHKNISLTKMSVS